jgi:DNA-binding transcriptional ArsR family regulator
MSKVRKRDTVVMHNALAATANLLGEPARAAMLLHLLSGRALPAGELALVANISPQTASGHLAKLVEGSLLDVERQGRHRYYRVAGTEVANAVEALLTLTAAARPLSTRRAALPTAGTLAHSRTCYAHLAGWLGVQIADALQSRSLLLPASGKAFAVTDNGRAWFKGLGIDVRTCGDRATPKLAKQCLDWTERRPHLAGSLGIAMYERFVALKWIACLAETRAVRVTFAGKQELWKHLGIPLG